MGAHLMCWRNSREAGAAAAEKTGKVANAREMGGIKSELAEGTFRGIEPEVTYDLSYFLKEILWPLCREQTW